VLLVAVITFTLGGARATAAAQLVLICLLVVLVAVAVIGAAPAARTANWAPFRPHGWASVGRATSILMMSAVGWEAIAPLTARLRDPGRQLPRVILIAFGVTSIFYLGLAVSTIAVLGSGAGSSTVLSDLLRVAVGAAGPAIAAVAAVALTLATTNAYLTGAAALAAALRKVPDGPAERGSLRLQIGTGAVGLLILGGVATGLLSTAQLVALPTALFLTVYLGCTAAATVILTGRTRVIAALTFVAVAVILCFTGWALLAVLAVLGMASLRSEGRQTATIGSHQTCLPSPEPAR
jgi:amino acid efflux transporter